MRFDSQLVRDILSDIPMPLEGARMGWAIAAVVVAFLIIWRIQAARKREAARVAAINRRRHELLLKYDNESLVDRLMRSEYWQGMTEEQLFDSKGMPADIDEQILKTRVKRTWKYDQTGKNRFALRVYVEDGVVVGWKL